MELVDSTSPATVGFSADGGRASTIYLCTSDNLVDSLQDLLGYTEKAGNGALRRVLPKAHPRFPWLFVERISNIQGIGQFTKTASSTSVEADAVGYGASYDYYKITVEFTPRPYALVDNDQITPAAVSWTESDGSTVSDIDSKEWCRYVSLEVIPSVELVTAQQGQMILRTGTILDPTKPNLYTFPGQPSIRLPRAQVVMTWYQVPYDFVTDTNGAITTYMGRINQTAFFGFPAGSLLYATPPRVRVYTPPWPAETTVPGGGVTYFDRRCDIAFTFEYVSRTTPSAPTPANANWLAAGHNLLPWFGDRKFYYATAFDPASVGTDTSWYPTYLSFPFQLLFSDPNGVLV